MIRALTVAVAAAALAVAGPTLAGQKMPDQQQAGTVAASGGGLPSPLSSSGAQATTGDLQYVTGDVVMTTPGEIVLHTDQGMQRFAIGPQVENGGYIPVQGERVTLGYVPAAGTATVTTMQRAAANAAPASPSSSVAAQTASTDTSEQEAVTGGESPHSPGGTNPETNPAPVAPASATAAESTTAAPATGLRAHAAQLPKTASDRPLILLLGVVALAAAAVVRAVARA